jgi:hypothetical protein
MVGEGVEVEAGRLVKRKVGLGVGFVVAFMPPVLPASLLECCSGPFVAPLLLLPERSITRADIVVGDAEAEAAGAAMTETGAEVMVAVGGLWVNSTAGIVAMVGLAVLGALLDAGGNWLV